MYMMHKTSYALVIVGALNWGLVALFDFNLVSAIFGSWPAVEKLIYIVIGLAALWEAMIHMTYCKYCMMEMGSGNEMMMAKMPAKKKSRRK